MEEGVYWRYMIDEKRNIDQKEKGDGPSEPSPYQVRETRVELARHCWHYLLRVARLPISPPALRMECKVTKIFHILTDMAKYFNEHA